MLRKRQIDSIIILHPANVSYLAGFVTNDSYLFINKEKSLLITDSRYSVEYKNCLRDNAIEIFESNKKLPIALKAINKIHKIKNLAFEDDGLSHALYKILESIFHRKLIPTSGIVEQMRIIKEPEELTLIRKAISITQDSLRYIKSILKPGMRETELAAEIERYIRLKGAMGSSFDIIVASGPNSSLPHAKKTDRRIANNEPVLIDMGVEYKGYKSDLTRTFFLGRMNTLFKNIYDTVQAAQLKALNSIKPEVSIEYIDGVARNIIEKNGFKDCFKHSLGHGIGLETHELPRIAPKNKKKLKEGMVFTIEPGIYLDNKFGVRIEDMVLVTTNGREVLSVS
jgi:Xaa-Pro aminopeptidase